MPSTGLQSVAVRFTYIRAQSHQLPSLKHTKTYQNHFKALLQTMRRIRSTTKGPQKAQTYQLGKLIHDLRRSQRTARTQIIPELQHEEQEVRHRDDPTGTSNPALEAKAI
ncbi:hypothetical protein K435DRAFT_869919 [Dendrothele bispora CBS 962.96]|uniref:Uncharacterized protein n=1 Tax=Dendrothele bispora (strain CBS 962.96) TaxID=1314807 RepID=A0A4V4HCV8_DENBC|nr:hypothetical protein K435DRAFT_869919 [Dendrothele bispora CBS 962.96]